VPRRPPRRGARRRVLRPVPRPYRPAPTTQRPGVHRDGGLDDLLAEAGRPTRRFDFVITFGVDRLSRDTARVTAILRHLATDGVEFLAVPHRVPGSTPLPMPYLRSAAYLDVFTQLLREGTIR
jgi:hypothetical protein